MITNGNLVAGNVPIWRDLAQKPATNARSAVCRAYLLTSNSPPLMSTSIASVIGWGSLEKRQGTIAAVQIWKSVDFSP